MSEYTDKRFKGKRNTNGLDKNKQNININGRPKKGISLVNAKLKAKGYHPARKEDIEVNYMQMIQLDKEEMVKMSKDKTQPMLVRIIAENLLNRKGFDIIEKMLDRGIGKATQNIDQNINGKVSLVDLHKKANVK